MNGFEAYKIYVAVKAHFTSEKYDYFKYGVNTKTNLSTFLQRADKIHFDKLAKKFPNKDDLILLVAANLVFDSSTSWVKSLMEETSLKKFRQRKKVLESLTYSFTNDCSKIVEYMHQGNLTFDQLFSCSKGHPPILKLVLEKRITPETFCIFDQLIGFSKDVDHHLSTDPLWNESGKRLVRYSPFVNIGTDRKKFKDIYLNKYHQYTGEKTNYVATKQTLDKH